jgi:hypothetical protein
VLVIDSVFTAPGLAALRRYFEGNTMWHNMKVGGLVILMYSRRSTNSVDSFLPDVISRHILGICALSSITDLLVL